MKTQSPSKGAYHLGEKIDQSYKTEQSTWRYGANMRILNVRVIAPFFVILEVSKM